MGSSPDDEVHSEDTLIGLSLSIFPQDMINTIPTVVMYNTNPMSNIQVGRMAVGLRPEESPHT
jgi:hypothetical protein